MEVTKHGGIYYPQIFFFKLKVAKHLMKLLKGFVYRSYYYQRLTHKGSRFTLSSPQKPILGLCPGHTRILKVHKNGIHMQYKAAPRGLAP